MSAPRKPQGRGVADLLSPRRKSENREVLPVFPRGLFKFDPVDFWTEAFFLAAAQHLEDDRTDGSGASHRAGAFADAALDVAEKRWGSQRVKGEKEC